ncbi:hypothetical protein PPROV_000898300 [Pycnococcus provasolii]|uniref:Uncharacterized protein n=1 Tax=Pycnococcus provasolii TaxID=41880 RepID=A0A830HXU7_9CHLO|nr:hypothetical protein PPROV_000898300 [Pycnococcus provasolii]
MRARRIYLVGIPSRVPVRGLGCSGFRLPFSWTFFLGRFAIFILPSERVMNVMPVDIRVPPASTASHLLLRDKAIAVWLDWLVTVHRPRRLAAVQERRIRRARANAVISAGNLHSLALRADGSVACWGCNDDGQAPTDASRLLGELNGTRFMTEVRIL